MRLFALSLLAPLALATCGGAPAPDAQDPAHSQSGPPGMTAPLAPSDSSSWNEPPAQPQAQPRPIAQPQPQPAAQPQPERQPAAQPQPRPSASALPAAYQEILDRHNQLRAQHCAAPLQWSSELARVAQDWADRLEDAGCAFDHRPNNRFGENLSFYAPASSMGPADVADGWYDEVREYDFASGRFGFRTGHFTQLVWASTTAMGCGVSQCNGGVIWVCNYDPPGNVMGEFQRNVQPNSCRR